MPENVVHMAMLLRQTSWGRSWRAVQDVFDDGIRITKCGHWWIILGANIVAYDLKEKSSDSVTERIVPWNPLWGHSCVRESLGVDENMKDA